MLKQTIYLIGSLRNPVVPLVGKELRALGYDVFDDWYAGGPEADDKWKDYEETRGRSYPEALKGYMAKHIFEFDLHHLQRAHIGILVAPAGKSGHLELGFMLGQGKTGFVLLPNDPERWDIMYQFAHGVFFDKDDLFAAVAGTPWPAHKPNWKDTQQRRWEKAHELIDDLCGPRGRSEINHYNGARA